MGIFESFHITFESINDLPTLVLWYGTRSYSLFSIYADYQEIINYLSVFLAMTLSSTIILIVRSIVRDIIGRGLVDD